MTLSHSQQSLAWLTGLATFLVATALALVMISSAGPGALGTVGAPPHPFLAVDPLGRPRAAEVPIEQFLPTELLELGAEDAMARNLAMPIARGPNPAAPAFSAQWLGKGLAEATTCLAQAVYYEAAGEPIAGQRAVAQVVLNRLRNPHYPKTICEVIYQGADKSTGCQFSFACDGSVAHVPTAEGWRIASAIATSALNGMVSVRAGQATHYHSLAVYPAWAPQLAKIGIIGGHVFYRPRHRMNQGYDGILKAAPGEGRMLAETRSVPSSAEIPPRSGESTSSQVMLAANSVSPDRPSMPLTPVSVPANTVAGQAPGSRQIETAGERTGDSGAMATKPSPSMFSYRRARRLNLPLPPDH